MCNSIHKHGKRYIPKKKRGKGYKIFTYKNNKYYPLTNPYLLYENENGKIEWNALLLQKDYITKESDDCIVNNKGFCFFFNKKEAERTRKAWLNITHYFCEKHFVIKPIYYENCLIRQEEKRFITGYTFDMGLCKQFTFLDEE